MNVNNASNRLTRFSTAVRRFPGQARRDHSPLEFPFIFVHESYNVFRKRALEKRFLTATRDGDHDMDVLCQFWSHFLVHNFNAQMYNEFRSLALDDFSARRAGNRLNGLIHLLCCFFVGRQGLV